MCQKSAIFHRFLFLAFCRTLLSLASLLLFLPSLLSPFASTVTISPFLYPCPAALFIAVLILMVEDFW